MKKNVVKIPLKVNEYVFSYQGKDLRKATLEYQYNQKKTPFFYFCLEAKDELGKNFAFEYDLNMGMNELYALPLKPITSIPTFQ